MNNQSKSHECNSNTTQAQRQRLRTYLKNHRKITRFKAEKQLNILSLAARIYELRHKENLNIVRYWLVDHTDAGKPHKVALYVLFTGNYGDGANDE